jgi:potassium channel LctB
VRFRDPWTLRVSGWRKPMTLTNALLLAGTALFSGYFGFRMAKAFVANVPDTSIPLLIKSRMYVGAFGLNLILLLSLIIYFLNGTPTLGPIRVFCWIFILSFDATVFSLLSKVFMSARDIPLRLYVVHVVKAVPRLIHRIAKPDYYTLAVVLTLIYTIDDKGSLDLAVILLFFIAYRAIRLFLDISSGQITTDIKRGPFGTFMVLLSSVFVMIVIFAKIYSVIGLSAGTMTTKTGEIIINTTTDFYDCLYSSVVTWTTLGYGDLTPIGLGRVYAAVEALTGYVVMSVMIAALISLSEILHIKKETEKDQS